MVAETWLTPPVVNTTNMWREQQTQQAEKTSGCLFVLGNYLKAWLRAPAHTHRYCAAFGHFSSRAYIVLSDPFPRINSEVKGYSEQLPSCTLSSFCDWKWPSDDLGWNLMTPWISPESRQNHKEQSQTATAKSFTFHSGTSFFSPTYSGTGAVPQGYASMSGGVKACIQPLECAINDVN